MVAIVSRIANSVFPEWRKYSINEVVQPLLNFKTSGQTDRQTERRTDKQTDRQTCQRLRQLVDSMEIYKSRPESTVFLIPRFAKAGR